MDILAAPAAKIDLCSTKADKSQGRPLNLDDENFGL